MTRRRQTHADIFITDVEGLTLRDFTGDGRQSELLIRTRTGTLAVRLIARRGKVPRLVDMRAADRRKKKLTFVQGAQVRPFIEERKVG